MSLCRLLYVIQQLRKTVAYTWQMGPPGSHCQHRGVLTNQTHQQHGQVAHGNVVWRQHNHLVLAEITHYFFCILQVWIRPLFSLVVCTTNQQLFISITNFLRAVDSQQEVLYVFELSGARTAAAPGTVTLTAGTLADTLALWHSAWRRSNDTRVDMHSASTSKN